jgi:hypothetical protein
MIKRRGWKNKLGEWSSRLTKELSPWNAGGGEPGMRHITRLALCEGMPFVELKLLEGSDWVRT